MKIFIGNLGNEIASPDLFQLFSKFGKVMWADVAKDRKNNPRGFGYVYMHTATAGDNAIATLNKKQFMQQYLWVSEALCNEKTTGKTFFYQ
jgi:heterogeneous nuclear ribonucleoprotein G